MSRGGFFSEERAGHRVSGEPQDPPEQDKSGPRETVLPKDCCETGKSIFGMAGSWGREVVQPLSQMEKGSASAGRG